MNSFFKMIDLPPNRQCRPPLPSGGGAFAHWPPPHRLPVLLSFDDIEHAFILAWLRREAVEFVYWGGSEPGRRRRARVEELFRLAENGPAYALSWCETRHDYRCFRLDRASLPSLNPQSSILNPA